MLIVAFGHRSRAGKDTAAKMLIQKCRMAGFLNVQHVPFARKLKQAAKMIFGQYGLQDEAFYNTAEGEKLRDTPLPVCNLTPVQIWVALGDVLKRATYPNIWIDSVLSVQCDILVISDLRYVHEAEAIHTLGGILVRVDSPNSVTKPSDSYLADYTKWDFVINNSGTIRDLDEQVQVFYDKFVRQP